MAEIPEFMGHAQPQMQTLDCNFLPVYMYIIV